MIEDILAFNSIRGEFLDAFLSAGWYRMGKFIFTTNYIKPFDDGQLFRVFWLRYKVREVAYSKSAQKILNAGKGFSWRYRPFETSPEMLDLHDRYRAGIDFQIGDDLEEFSEIRASKIYDTYKVEVFDGATLIAVGIFDVGDNAIAGIKNFYNHDYARYSPGKLLMILKHLFCLEHGFDYYYPGYFSTELAKFDYKLFLDKRATEVLYPEMDAWVGYERFAQHWAGKKRKV